MTNPILYATEHMAGKYRAGYYINSALSPTWYDLERADYEKTRDQYQPFEEYWDGDHGNLIVFYDTAAQLEAHNAEADDLAETQDDASYRSQ
jgi:hypothetical protein